MGGHKIWWDSDNSNRSPIRLRHFLEIELYPPFLRKEFLQLQDDAEEEETFRDEIDDRVTVCSFDVQRELFNIQEEKVSPCKDDCRRKKLTCEEFRAAFEEQIASGAEIGGSEFFDALKTADVESYQRSEDDSIDEEVDDEGRRKKLFPWLVTCESVDTLSNAEVPPNTTDPYICHELYLPYNKIPRPRQFNNSGEGITFTLTSLPRRPRSPVRQMLPDQCKLDAAFEERDEKSDVMDKRKILEESKQRISMSMMQLPYDQSDRNMFISSVVLQAVCEQVTLTLIDTRIDTNIHTFVNVALFWALSEMQLLDDDLISDEHLQIPDDFIYCQHIRRRIMNMRENGGIRKLLLGAYKPPISRNIYTTLHRRLPWAYVCPSHEQGHMKFYPTIRERIEEKDSDTEVHKPMSTYITDVMCFHHRDILDNYYVAYRRRSKYFSLSSPDDTRDDAFLQLMNII